jgi:DNA-binding IclR family transcriptional regulator
MSQPLSTSAVPVSDRVLSVLDLFMGPRPEWTIEEAAAAMAIPASTAYRYFRSLAAHGLIYDHLPGRYILGAAVMRLDRQMRIHDPLVKTVAPVMGRLAEAVGRPCVVLLARLYQDAVMCVHQIDHLDPDFAVSYERGRMMPLDRGATSKVIFANLQVNVLRRLARSQPELALHDADRRRDLRRVRADGYCVAHGEVDPGRIGIAVPIFLPYRKQVASLSVVVASGDTNVEGIVAALCRQRHVIETAITADAN